MQFDADDHRSRSVLVHGIKDVAAVRAWCTHNIPADCQPTVTARNTSNGDWVVRATFTCTHHAALFRMFWDGGAPADI